VLAKLLPREELAGKPLLAIGASSGGAMVGRCCCCCCCCCCWARRLGAPRWMRPYPAAAAAAGRLAAAAAVLPLALAPAPLAPACQPLAPPAPRPQVQMLPMLYNLSAISPQIMGLPQDYFDKYARGYMAGARRELAGGGSRRSGAAAGGGLTAPPQRAAGGWQLRCNEPLPPRALPPRGVWHEWSGSCAASGSPGPGRTRG
jgi:hypothetical protein